MKPCCLLATSIYLKATALVAKALLVGLSLFALPAHAVYTVIVTEGGGNVTFTGSGSINLTGLICGPPGGGGLAAMSPTNGYVGIGTSTDSAMTSCSGSSGPFSYGSGGFIFPSSTTGSLVQRLAGGGFGVPNGYASGAPLGTSTSVFAGSISSLGLTIGTYTWTWGTGANADSFVLYIGVAPPPPPPAANAEPIPTLNEWAMIFMASVLAIFGYARLRKRRS